MLTALEFGQRDVYGVEINPLIVDLVTNRFGEFTGHLYSRPNVHIAVDDGRSYVARSDMTFDVILSSFTDTWAATAAGAFALTENTLYTREAFADYYRHLTPDGILSMSRFYTPPIPAETMRLVATGLAAWRDMGVSDPAQNVIVVATEPTPERSEGMTTLLMKKSAFSPDEVNTIRGVSDDKGFAVLYSPLSPPKGDLGNLITASDPSQFYRNYPLDITPPTDNKPFFFHMLRMKDFLRLGITQGSATMNVRAISILGALLAIVVVLTLLFILGPLWAFKRAGSYAKGRQMSSLSYFACLGLAFMLVEIPLMQRFILFLGNPTYSLAVILFSLLLFAGLGSFTTNRLTERARSFTRWLILALAAMLTLYVVFLPQVLGHLMALERTTKIVITVLILLPLGFLMGTPFPLGIKLVSRDAAGMVPWIWGVNGATSVLASVLAVVIAITFGITAAMATGLAFYFLAFLILPASRRSSSQG